MKKIGLCLIICMSMLTQTVFAHANSSEEISSEIDNKLPTVAIQFGKTKLNIGNELTLLQDEGNTSILFAGHQIQIANLNVKNVLGMGDAIQLLEENDCDNVLLVGEAIEMKGQYNKVYVSGANVVFEGQSDVLNIVGETIELTGTVKTASLTGDTVVISGTVTGQLKIAANHVEFTEDANVEGDIVIWSENQATVSNQLSEDRITYHHEDVIKWGYWLPTSLSIEMNWIAYGSLMVLTMLFGTLGLLSVRRIFSNVKRKAWRFVGLQVLISISVPLICAWGLSTYMAFKWLTIMTMYLSIWLALTPVICLMILGCKTFLKRYWLVVGLLSIVVYECLMLYPHLSWRFELVNMILILGSIGTNLVKNRKLMVKVKS